jgi:hypothetical protein
MSTESDIKGSIGGKVENELKGISLVGKIVGLVVIVWIVSLSAWNATFHYFYNPRSWRG